MTDTILCPLCFLTAGFLLLLQAFLAQCRTVVTRLLKVMPNYRPGGSAPDTIPHLDIAADTSGLFQDGGGYRSARHSNRTRRNSTGACENFLQLLKCRNNTNPRIQLSDLVLGVSLVFAPLAQGFM